MTQKDVERKQIILIDYIQELVNNYTTEKWKIKAEYSTNDNDKRVITIQEQTGQKEVFYGNIMPMFNYYMFDIYGLSIQECKNISLMLGYLIGKNVIREVNNNGKLEKWQIMFIQWANPQPIEYLDIRRVGYNATYKCVVNKIYEEE
ncbi:hypothetical protein [Methanobrevibacter smithii]|uniref:hypothetical protein n=1 Tax=Methanobrevibacter smithii TaxID=2173 RepID=UPI0037DCE857